MIKDKKAFRHYTNNELGSTVNAREFKKEETIKIEKCYVLNTS